MPLKTLPDKIVSSSAWVISLIIIRRFLFFIQVIILARLLNSFDFGLMGIGLLVKELLETFSDIGFQAALIQKKENIHEYLDTAWTVLVIRGFFIVVILFIIAPLTADFFRAPQLKFIIPIIGISMLLTSSANIGTVYFEKNLIFYKYFLYKLSGSLSNFIVAVLVALIMRNYWALIFGLLAGNITEFIFSYWAHPYRPHFSIDLNKGKYLFNFGKWMLLSGALLFFLTQGGDIFVGKMLGLVALGFYQVAYKISNTLPLEMEYVIRRVTFPVYSRLQDELLKLGENYLKVLQITTFVSLPLAGGIFILGSEFTMLFLGARWMPIVPVLQILAVFSIFRLIRTTIDVVFLSVGRMALRTKIHVAQFIFLAVLIYPLTRYLGIRGAALAVTIPALLFNVVALHKVTNIIGIHYNKVMKIIIFPLLATLIMIIAVLLIKHYIFGTLNIVSFFFTGLVSFFIYLFIIYLFDLFFHYGFKQLCTAFLQRIDNRV